MTAPVLTRGRVRPRDSQLVDLPFPTTSDVSRAVARALIRGDLRRARVYQQVIYRRLREAQTRPAA